MQFSTRCMTVLSAAAIPAVLLCASGNVRALAQGSPAVDAACKAYVQKFYDYYAKDVTKDSKTSPDIRAINNRNFSFSEQLKSQLKADNAAAGKSPDEVVGLDFDPFLNSQENVDSCTAQKVTHKGDHYLVDVYETLDKKKDSKPSVTPELELKDGKWTFVNFHYGKSDIPENENLLSVLKTLRNQRTKGK